MPDGRCPKCGAIHDFELKRRLCTGNRRTYAFDLDGTLCFPAHTLQLQIDPDIIRATKPIEAHIEYVRRLKKQGNIILVHSARATNQYMPTLEWLADYGVPHDGLVLGKPFADLYVDDHGVSAQDFFKSKGVKE